MVPLPKLQLSPYIGIVKRRVWWIIITFGITLLAAVTYIQISPKIYRATTLILLEPQSIPDSYVRSTVTETVEGRLRTITQQIHSRTNLEEIIRDFQIDRRQADSMRDRISRGINRIGRFFGKEDILGNRATKDSRVLISELVEEIRKNLQVTMRSGLPGSGGRQQSLAFEIIFEWPDSEMVAPVTNAVASRFITANLNAREEIAMSTTDFLDKESSAIRSELEVREKELETFKKQHMGMLPDQLTSNINILNQLRDELLSLEGRLEQEKQQVILLRSQAQMARTERDAMTSVIRQDQGRGGGVQRESALTNDQLTSGSLDDLDRELKRLSSLYTDKHPDIIALKRRIETMRREGSTREGATSTASDAEDTASDRISLQLMPINANIESYKNQIREVEKQIQLYKDRVERTPQVEMAMNNILRDYQTVRQRYDNLLSKKLDAKLAEEMERRKKGEQFRVLDPAIKPPKPFRPDAMKVMAIAFALGLGLGGGLAYLREMLDPNFYHPEEVESLLEVEVIVSLPMADAECVNDFETPSSKN